MKYLLVVLCLASVGCASMTPIERHEHNLQVCQTLRRTDVEAGKYCFIEEGLRIGLPVKCMYLIVDGHRDEGRKCFYKHQEQLKLAQEARAQYALDHPIDVTPELQYLADKWSAKPKEQAPVSHCTTSTFQSVDGPARVDTNCN